MFGRFKNERTSYGIVGLGRFGLALAYELAASGAELLALDMNEDIIREVREFTDNAFVVKNLDKKTLMESGIQNCDVAVVGIGEKLDTSILTTLNLVSMGIPTVISKAASAEHGEILAKLGAEVVYPERDMAVRLANRLENYRSLDYVHVSEKLNISKLPVPDKLIGKTVIESGFRSEFGTNIIAIENGRNVIESVQPDYSFCREDIIYVCGGREDLSRLSEWLAKD